MNEADQEILDHFTRTRDKTIELLGTLPDDWLARTPDGEDRDLAAIFEHIALGVDHWMENCMGDRGQADRTPRKTKAALVAALENSRDRLVRFFQRDGGQPMHRQYAHQRDKSVPYIGRNRVLYLTQHEAHHRGKVVLAVRQWGFTDVPFLPY